MECEGNYCNMYEKPKEEGYSTGMPYFGDIVFVAIVLTHIS